MCSITGRSNSTVQDWFNLCLDIYYALFESRNETVEIDEFLLRGKRKYTTEVEYY